MGGGVLQRMWVLRGPVAAKTEKVVGRQKTMHDEEIHNFVLFTKCYKEEQIKKNEMGK